MWILKKENTNCSNYNYKIFLYFFILPIPFTVIEKYNKKKFEQKYQKNTKNYMQFWGGKTKTLFWQRSVTTHY